MGDGWETKRKRIPGYDWTILKLACAGEIKKIVVDTNFFKGNYPDSCLVEGCILDIADEDKLKSGNVNWITVLPQTKLQADHEHYFDQISSKGPFTHLRLTIFPDGGISRMRVFGKKS